MSSIPPRSGTCRLARVRQSIAGQRIPAFRYLHLQFGQPARGHSDWMRCARRDRSLLDAGRECATARPALSQPGRCGRGLGYAYGQHQLVGRWIGHRDRDLRSALYMVFRPQQVLDLRPGSGRRSQRLFLRLPNGERRQRQQQRPCGSGRRWNEFVAVAAYGAPHLRIKLDADPVPQRHNQRAELSAPRRRSRPPVPIRTLSSRKFENRPPQPTMYFLFPQC